VRILQRCPIWTKDVFQDAAQDPEVTEILTHENGIVDADTESVYKHHQWHDPTDLGRARSFAEDTSRIRLGLFYRDENKPCYDETRRLPVHTTDERIAILNAEFDRYAV